MKWSYAEFDAAHNLYPWAVNQVVDAYVGIARLLGPAQRSIWQGWDAESPRTPVRVLCDSASRLSVLADDSVTAVCVDPPYYDNVQYSELADFFYVWAKRALALEHGSKFRGELSDKDDEAVANPYRFRDFGKSRSQLAKKDYEAKMDAIFREVHRVLRSDGVLTVMFTHKQVEAWDTLAASLIGAGFQITASWPIHTEMANSLSIRGNASAQTTILLACRKRGASAETVWWDDLKAAVRRRARSTAEELAEDGFTGVDLYIAAFGPALSVISEKWPVLTSDVDDKTGQPMAVRPEAALDLAREEVLRLRKEGLLRGRLVTFDPVTDWYLMAWDAFRAEEFPADEARKLAIAVGIDAMEDVLVRRERLISKKASSVVLQQPKARRKRDVIDPDAGAYPVLIDAVHTAMLLLEEGGLPACREFLRRTGYLTDGTFHACVQALLNAIPRTRDKRGFVRPEAAALDAMRNAFFGDLAVPPEEEVELPAATQTTFAWGGEEEVGEELEESDDTEEE
jgi:adenine-specific DNA methylase